MKNYELKINNSKKLIIGVSILFCTVILIIGTSIAYFTQSGSGTTGNIVTTDINGTLKYTDNNDYMRNDLIPVMGSDVDDFAMKNSLNGYTDNDICVYTSEYNACSLYEFTITNNANVTQELMITLNPTPNGYGNLYYMMYEEEQETLTTSSIVAKSSTHINGNGSSVMIKELVLKPNESKTYTVVFYILNLENTDQTSVDAGKNFGAIIRVDSITTGTYVSNTIGETCYEMEEITEGDYVGTYKLTKFNGINEDGTIVEGCGVTQDDEGFYSVTVPSNVGGQQISTLGNTLFMGVSDLTTFSINTNTYINNITIEEGIEVIEDAEVIDSYTSTGTFSFIGLNDDFSFVENFEFNIDLPDSLSQLGFGMFYINPIYNLSIPKNTKNIDKKILNGECGLTSLTFEGAEDGESKLITIGDEIFHSCQIESLVIPASVTMIGNDAFYGNSELTRITFIGADNYTSNLKTIGERAFGDAHLYYVDDSLLLPSTIESIGKAAFSIFDSSHRDFKNILFMGTRENLDKLGTDWYTSDFTTNVKAYVE